jgi:hypothetical protein
MRYPWFSLLIPVLVMLLAAACGLVPLAGPESATSTSPAAPGLLAGTITGLAPGASASLRLERLALTQPSDQDQAVLRFSVTNGWQQTCLALNPGRYRLIPEAEGYVGIRLEVHK